MPAAADDPALLADYLALNDPAQRREVERRGAFFVVEGFVALAQLARSRHPIRSVLVAEDRRARADAVLADAGRVGVRLLERPADEVARIVGFHFHRGVLAAAERCARPSLDAVLADARVVAVAEGLNDHENIGALFRNAAAFGVGGVVFDPSCADPLYRRSIRVSQGQVLVLPWTRAAAWPDDLARVAAAGFEVLALTPSSDAQPIDEVAAGLAGRRVAILVGAEGPGLSPAALALGRPVRIPIRAEVDSLNVATAAAVAFHVLSS